MGIKTWLLLAGASIAVATWPVGPALAAAPAAGPLVPTLVVQPRDGASWLAFDGSIQPVRQATLAAQSSGAVLAMAVKAGDRVRTGQLIARLDAREAQAGVDRSDASLAQAEAEARQAAAQVERSRDLRRQGFISQAALDQAEAQARVSAAAVAQARAGRSASTLGRTLTTVVAPFDGVVSATHVEVGDVAAPGRAIATLFAPQALRVVVSVGLTRSAALRTATHWEIETADGRRLRPVRRTELASADAATQTVEWRLDLDSADLAGLLPGQSVQVRVGTNATADGAGAAVPRIPASALLRRGELTAVYLARSDGFVLRAVRLGADRGPAGIDVLAGLKPGERIAADAERAGLAGARPAP